LPSRMFAGPGDFPPKDFKAYGIVASNMRPTADDKARYDMICDGYVAGILHFTDVKVPRNEQMVTVWPVENVYWAKTINKIDRDKVCGLAVPHYGFSLAEQAIKDARTNDIQLNGKGPFLLAWAPGEKKGLPGAIVLVYDLSDVINSEQAKQIFTRWAQQIQDNPQLWNKWDLESARIATMLWADKWGDKIVKAIKSLKV
jgi:hypothetical protein